MQARECEELKERLSAANDGVDPHFTFRLSPLPGLHLFLCWPSLRATLFFENK